MEPEWPEVECIIGNPPFLGGQKMRRTLGDIYVEAVRGVYHERVPGTADLVTFWFANLYNARPTWLMEIHRRLDEAVFAAYGWPSTLTDAELLERLFRLNHERAA